MKAILFLPLLTTLSLAASSYAEDAADLRAPKSESPRLLRIFLFVPGFPRLIDYPDVEKILCCEKDRIAFETQDGHTVLHQGPYTVIQPRTGTSTQSDGTKFYDIK